VDNSPCAALDHPSPKTYRGSHTQQSGEADTESSALRGDLIEPNGLNLRPCRQNNTTIDSYEKVGGKGVGVSVGC
jgi:hypothetical protein